MYIVIFGPVKHPDEISLLAYNVILVGLAQSIPLQFSLIMTRSFYD